MQLSFWGILIGVISFASIGVFHPIVIKAEYHFGKECWPWFLVAGLIFLGVSVFIQNIVLGSALAVVGMSCLWSILELFEQEERVKKGWFPANPKRERKEK